MSVVEEDQSREANMVKIRKKITSKIKSFLFTTQPFCKLEKFLSLG